MDMDAPYSFPPPTSPPIASPPIATIDPARQARLDRLAASRGSRDQPPTSGQSAPSSGRRRKRHAAKRTRAAAAMMSITATGALTAYFHRADTAAASKNANALTGVAVASGTAATSTTAAA